MKVKSALIFLFIVSTSCAFAQILVGPTIGANYSWVKFGDKDFKNDYKVKPMFGYSGGVNLSFRVQKRFFLHTSVIYSTKGKMIEGKDDKLLRNKLVNRYLELPILYTVEFKKRLKGGKEYKWYFGGGPNISYWLGGKGTFFNSELAENAVPSEVKYKVAFHKSSDQINGNEMGVRHPNRVLLGLNLSAGLVFEPITNHEFMLTVRYEIGHSYFSRTSDGTFQNSLLYQDNLKVQTRSLRISLAYLIDLNTGERKKGKSTIKKKYR